MRTNDRLAAPQNRIAFPLDYGNMLEARNALQMLKDDVGIFKVGLELFSLVGQFAFTAVHDVGGVLFADLKLHDIPETVERATAVVAQAGAQYLTVHTSGGRKMLERAVRRAETESSGKLAVLAVTVLTSLTKDDLWEQGITLAPGDQAVHLARIAWEVGVRGFVCSPLEAGPIRAALGPEALLVTPGVRPAGADMNDQARVATPAEAIARGADILVIGRPIRNASNPVEAAREIAKEIAVGLERRQKGI
jgi:orotidine-5'-phosphate decarboxylase